MWPSRCWYFISDHLHRWTILDELCLEIWSNNFITTILWNSLNLGVCKNVLESFFIYLYRDLSSFCEKKQLKTKIKMILYFRNLIHKNVNWSAINVKLSSIENISELESYRQTHARSIQQTVHSTALHFRADVQSLQNDVCEWAR